MVKEDIKEVRSLPTFFPSFAVHPGHSIQAWDAIGSIVAWHAIRTRQT